MRRLEPRPNYLQLTVENVRDFQKGWPDPFKTDADVGRAWGAMKVEMVCQKFAKRNGLPRNQVTVVVHGPTGKAYPQWVGAVPKALQMLK